MILSLHFLEQLDEALRERRIDEGIRLLEHAGADWTSPDLERGGAAIALRAAQWLDVGHRDRKSMEALLARFTPTLRARMPFRDYLELRLAEAFRALMTEDSDAAIEMLEFVLKAERELGDENLIILANFLHHFNPDTCATMLRKVKSSLAPKGRVCAVDFVPDEDRVKVPTHAMFAFLMLATTPDGDAWTSRDLDRMAKAAGFLGATVRPLRPTPQSLIMFER